MFDVLLAVGIAGWIGYKQYQKTVNNTKSSKNPVLVVDDLLKVSNLHELVTKTSARLEKYLKYNFDASGKGLHECISSVEDKLSPIAVRKLRKIASKRNKLVHEEVVFDIEEFKNDLKSVRDVL